MTRKQDADARLRSKTLWRRGELLSHFWSIVHIFTEIAEIKLMLTIKLSQSGLLLYNDATIRKDISKTNLLQCLHGCLGSPVVSTRKLAIANGNFITWPGIDTLSIDAHLPRNIASAKGHMDQERKNLQSTRIKLATDKIEIANNDDAFFPIADTPNVKTFAACAQIVPFVVKNAACHDLTGRFPHRSSRGNECLLVVCDHDSNSILHAALKKLLPKSSQDGSASMKDSCVVVISQKCTSLTMKRLPI
jgi:hypothetical protein